MTSLRLLGVAYRVDGQTKKTVSIVENLVAIGGRILSEERTDDYHLSRSLQSHTVDTDRRVKTILMLGILVAIRGRTLKEDDAVQLTSQLMLAIAFFIIGMLKR